MRITGEGMPPGLLSAIRNRTLVRGINPLRGRIVSRGPSSY